MTRRTLHFMEPFRVEIREHELPPPGPGEVLIRSRVSAISAGTELLFYTGRQPRGMRLDTSIAGLEGSTDYPLRYGYALAGEIIAAGSPADQALIGRLAFAFHPHASHALVRREEAVILPEGMDPADAVFFPNMETAINLVMDGAPSIGERVAIVGLGVVGLLTGAVLAGFPLAGLYGLDTAPSRRRSAAENGLDACFESAGAAGTAIGADGVDLVYELSGNPAALGGDFHRNRVRLFSSQVSTLAPGYTGRWTKERRAAVAWKELERLAPRRFISHRIPFDRAAEAYELIASGSDAALQVVLQY